MSDSLSLYQQENRGINLSSTRVIARQMYNTASVRVRETETIEYRPVNNRKLLLVIERGPRNWRGIAKRGDYRRREREGEVMWVALQDHVLTREQQHHPTLWGKGGRCRNNEITQHTQFTQKVKKKIKKNEPPLPPTTTKTGGRFCLLNSGHVDYIYSYPDERAPSHS